MKRRDFVKNVSLAGAALPFAVQGMNMEAVSKKLFPYNAKSAGDRVLIIIRLNGGNDGLNTVIPRDQYANLTIQRSNVLIPETSVLPLTTTVGLHPVMTGFQNMYNDGKLSILQNVGYPEQNRSHFRSMDIWTSGSLDVTETRGWLGRHFDNEYPNFPDAYPNQAYPDPFALSMGYEVSATCQGLIGNFSHAVSDPYDTFNLANNQTINDGTYYGDHMEYLSNLIAQTNAYGQQVNDAVNAGNSMSSMYDANNPIAVHLRNIARMITGGLQTKVYVLNINGFDTHDAQVVGGATTTGVHANLLKQLSDAVAAFQNDIQLLGIEHRVAGMTFSEFGRQIASNASLGTDHGDAAPMFLFGACISAGIVGPNPVITNTVVNQAGIPMEIDFRDVYASMLKDWFEVPETAITPLFEHTVTFIPVMAACNVTSVEELAAEEVFGANLFPNPAENQSTLRINGTNEWIQVRLLDMQGRELKVVFEGTLTEAEHILPIELYDYASGTYFVHIRSGEKTANLTLIKR